MRFFKKRHAEKSLREKIDQISKGTQKTIRNDGILVDTPDYLEKNGYRVFIPFTLMTWEQLESLYSALTGLDARAFIPTRIGSYSEWEVGAGFVPMGEANDIALKIDPDCPSEKFNRVFLLRFGIRETGRVMSTATWRKELDAQGMLEGYPGKHFGHTGPEREH